MDGVRREEPPAARAFAAAVAAVSTYYAARGDALATVCARRATVCEGVADVERLVLPALDEYGDDLPEALRVLLRDPPPPEGKA